jgi:hypothetical protein
VRRAPLLVLLLAAACAGAPPKPAPAAPPLNVPTAAPVRLPAGTVGIRIERLPPGAGWAVSWTLPHPVQEVRLTRPGHGDRKRQWILTTPGLSIVSADGEDRVVSSGAPFSFFDAVVAEYARKPEKDYQVFIPYTDGTVLLYTGAFEVRAPPAEDPWPTEFLLVPRKGNALVVGGAHYQGPATWRSSGDGTYAAFGNSPTMETPVGLAVVDGGMPAWLRDKTLLFALQVFGHYGVRTGWRLDVRPTLFLSYGREAEPGALSFGGGTLPGVVQIDSRMGSRFAGEADPVVWERQARLVAHEAAHLWLSHMFRPADGSSRWLDEGGADAWAVRALLDIGVVGRDRYRQILSEDAAECLRLLEEGSVRAAEAAGRWKTVYRCGEVASLATEAAGVRRDPPWDLLQFWGQVFYGARAGTYGESLWYDTLAGMPGGERVARTVRRMENRPDPALAGDVNELLQFAR